MKFNMKIELNGIIMFLALPFILVWWLIEIIILSVAVFIEKIVYSIKGTYDKK